MAIIYFYPPFEGNIFHDFLEIGTGPELDFVRDLARNVKPENAIQIEASAAFPIWKNQSSFKKILNKKIFCTKVSSDLRAIH